MPSLQVEPLLARNAQHEGTELQATLSKTDRQARWDRLGSFTTQADTHNRTCIVPGVLPFVTYKVIQDNLYCLLHATELIYNRLQIIC